MGYQLGVDLGTSYTAAAVCRDGRLELVSLGTRSLEIPSVVFLDQTGSLLVGEAAERRGAADPARLSREFKRRLGDPAPILLAGTPFAAEALMAAVLRSVVAEVSARQGEPPEHVTLSRPANWGPYKRELFDHVPVLADLGSATTATEPEAAAVHFASTTRVAPGGVIAVYDLGGGTFDAAVLRKTESGFAVLGMPEGIEHLGGADFDDAVFDYVRRILGEAFTGLDPTDTAVRTAAARLRAECVAAKEGLSRDTEVTIPVILPGVQTEVRLTRPEFEDLVRPALMSTVDSLRRAVRGSGVPAEEMTATVLAGGSSRIPLIAELIGSELGLPVAVGTHPKHTVALGAALLAARDLANPRADEDTGRFAVPAVVGNGASPALPEDTVAATGPHGETVSRTAGPEEFRGAPEATGSGLFGFRGRTGVLAGEDSPQRSRRSVLVVAALAVAAIVITTSLLVIRPWNRTGSASPIGPVAASSGVETTSAAETSGSAETSGLAETSGSAAATGETTTAASSSPSAGPTTAAAAGLPLIPTGASCEPTTIGVLAALIKPADPNSLVGEMSVGMRNAVELAVEAFNDANPDCQVGVKVFDTRYDSKTAAAKGKEIAEDPEVLAVVAATFSQDIAPAGPALDEGGLALMVPGAKSETLNSKRWKGFNRLIGTDFTQGPAAARFLSEELDARRVVVVDDTSTAGVRWADDVKAELGPRAAGRVTLKIDDEDQVAAAVAEVISANADAVYFGGPPGSAGKFVIQLRAAGYRGPFVMPDSEVPPQILKSTSVEDAEGVLVTCACSPLNHNLPFAAAYRDRFGGTGPPSYAAEAYDAAIILLKGVRDGIADRAAMVDYARSYVGTGITKDIDFDENGYMPGDPTFVMRVQDGVGVFVAFMT